MDVEILLFLQIIYKEIIQIWQTAWKIFLKRILCSQHFIAAACIMLLHISPHLETHYLLNWIHWTTPYRSSWSSRSAIAHTPVLSLEGDSPIDFTWSQLMETGWKITQHINQPNPLPDASVKLLHYKIMKATSVYKHGHPKHWHSYVSPSVDV